MTIEKTIWESDDEVSGCIELRKEIVSDYVSVTRFSAPQKVELTTQETKLKKTIEEISVDFIYNLRQTDGIDSIGWAGAGFLNGRLQYTGFTAYNKKEGKMCVNHSDFLGKKVKNNTDLKEAIKAYYRNDIQEFRQALESLPEGLKDMAKRLLL